MFYGDTVISETVADCQLCQPGRKLGLCPLAESLYFFSCRYDDILVLFTLLSDSIENPAATGMKESLSDSIRYYIRYGNTDTLDRMHTDADAPAPHTFAEHHLPYLRVKIFLFRYRRHCQYSMKKRLQERVQLISVL